MAANGSDKAFPWPLVRRLSTERLGVTLNNYYVWVCRGSIPHRYRLPLIGFSAGAITAADFERMDKVARRRPTIAQS